MFIPVPAPAINLGETFWRLEQEADLALRGLQLLARRLQALGHADDPQLAGLVAAGDATRQQAFVAEVNALLDADRDGHAVRQLRELTGLSWDQAHSLRSAWAEYASGQKTRWAQLFLLRQALASE